jgi:hypothetical protein
MLCNNAPHPELNIVWMRAKEEDSFAEEIHRIDPMDDGPRTMVLSSM